MDWKIIQRFPLYEVSEHAEVRRRKTGHICSVFFTYKQPCVALRTGKPGECRNLNIRHLMADLWPEARGWDRWKRYQNNKKDQRAKALNYLRGGFSPQFVVTKVDISLGELVVMKNRLVCT